jgi:hypothetical protein
MLRLLDARTSVLTHVRPERSGLLRVWAHLPDESREIDATGLRVLLLADLLARTAELSGLQVLTAIVFPAEPPGQPTFAERAAGPLGMHPPAVRASAADAVASLRGPAHIRIIGPDDDLYQEQAALVTQVGAVRITSPKGKHGAMFTGDNALAVRFALMSVPHHRAVELDETALARADQRTRSWRLRVAEWAESPSQPIPQGVGSGVQIAFSDLETVNVLTLLDQLADDPGLPPGARFETFVFADRILALDLAREVGRPRQ